MITKVADIQNIFIWKKTASTFPSYTYVQKGEFKFKISRKSWTGTCILATDWKLLRMKLRISESLALLIRNVETLNMLDYSFIRHQMPLFYSNFAFFE